MRFRNLRRRLSKPVFEPDLSELRAIFRDQRSFLHLDAVVARMRVSDDFAWILTRCQSLPDELIKAKHFRSTDFYHAVHRRTYCNSGDAARDIVGSHRLEEHMWH